MPIVNKFHVSLYVFSVRSLGSLTAHFEGNNPQISKAVNPADFMEVTELVYICLLVSSL